MQPIHGLNAGWLVTTGARKRKKIFPSAPQIQSAVIKTLAYAAVFNYPLTSEEVRKYLLLRTSQNMEKESRRDMRRCGAAEHGMMEMALRELLLSGKIEEKEGYYFMRGMESSVAQRKERAAISSEKLARAENFKNWARSIPTVKLIGISGALAMNNAHDDDDIDLFIVARTGGVWLTRFLMVSLAELLGARRRPEGSAASMSMRRGLLKARPFLLPAAGNENKIKNKICLNMFVDEKHMEIPEKERDLFSAHEVVQLKPIYNKDRAYERFLEANEWVKKYLPNAIQAPSGELEASSCNSKFKIDFSPVARFVENICKKFQLLHMRSRVTNEVIETGYLRFHPVDARRIILRRYRQILARIGDKPNEQRPILL